MSTLEKLSILGIRSFGIDKEDEQVRLIILLFKISLLTGLLFENRKYIFNRL